MPNPKDPFDSLEFDDRFVQSARLHEPAADERIRVRSTPLGTVEDEREAERRAKWRGRRRELRWWGVAVAALGVLLLGYWNLDGTGGYFGNAGGGPTTVVSADVFIPGDVGGKHPTPQQTAGTRLLPAVESVNDPHYRFARLRKDGTPVTYDACRPLHLVINPAGAPFDISTMVTDVATELTAATGLVITVDGTTDEPAGLNRQAFQPDRYGDQWAPVQIAWSDPNVIPGLDGSALGFGGSSAAIDPGGDAFYVSGVVYLDAPQFDEEHAEPLAATVLRHELGHVLGLDHVDAPHQVMFTKVVEPRTYADGDLTGLAHLGDGGCATSL